MTTVAEAPMPRSRGGPGQVSTYAHPHTGVVRSRSTQGSSGAPARRGRFSTGP